MKKASETEKGGIDMRCAIDEIKLHLKNKLHLSEDTANEYSEPHMTRSHMLLSRFKRQD